MVGLEIDDAALLNAIGKLESLDASVLLNGAGSLLASSTQQRFQDKVSPAGVPWRPVSDAYGDSKERSARVSRDDVLVLSGHLRDTIHYQVDGDAVLVGSPMKYGAVHQFGSQDGNTPARPFLGISAEDERDLETLLAEWVETALGGR